MSYSQHWFLNVVCQAYLGECRYVRTRRVDNRIHLVRLYDPRPIRMELLTSRSQLAGAAEGIAYLHENGIVHGNCESSSFARLIK